MSSAVEMKMTDDGFMRPIFVGDDKDDPRLVKVFKQSCPGMNVRAIKNPEAKRHETLGPIVGIWEAWATDDAFRTKGSSGGTLSALNAWMISRGIVSSVRGVAAAPNPRRTVPVTIMSKEDALASAGSRYAPVSALSDPESLESAGALVGKPCEVSARRAYEKSIGVASPIMMSFFCAGTPSQDATENLIEKLGIPKDRPLESMWYRGNGWPGEFTAIAEGGERVSTSYDESWGASLGPTVQWRCRICPDGVGESADITAGDFWEADEKGYPEFGDKPGRSVLIARTQRGYQLIQDAAADGVIEIRETNPDVVTPMQPYQYARRKYLMGRLLATRIFMGKVPTMRGFDLYKTLLKEPILLYKEFRGSITRIRHRSRAGIKS
ncbi:Coenzyme F420 hydrogenase/dehydrogenase, beta subunit C-terminal domain [Rothia sp. ZJ1223]|uniref:Coenzyme F420 hydrogenase/dehydrogenase, beta subunit C-terminal domain n=1 Tax=Rothia sp. ZJ1223 TaxID=2811098 RepID=UPI00195D7214|nr:Coenzyme F420 hydrogenase/dehydrogenase, beta subunit C-terminal domain [Rothia sp. ZJ1223]MBM7051414.1 Coenzyme F420 hydrogenase/dehydrogenase, beta subunit C-terminal domain [Rothia sp. ZJ1223]